MCSSLAGGLFLKGCGTSCPLVIQTPLEAIGNEASGEGAGGAMFIAGNTNGILNPERPGNMSDQFQATSNEATNGSYGPTFGTEPVILGDLHLIEVLSLKSSEGDEFDMDGARALNEPWLRDMPLAVAAGAFFTIEVGCWLAVQLL
jgi:hypothetical protein